MRPAQLKHTVMTHIRMSKCIATHLHVMYGYAAELGNMSVLDVCDYVSVVLYLPHV